LLELRPAKREHIDPRTLDLGLKNVHRFAFLHLEAFDQPRVIADDEFLLLLLSHRQQLHRVAV
jgi:hypothetical protein